MFLPNRIYYEKRACQYDVGQNILDYFKGRPNIEIMEVPITKVMGRIRAETAEQTYKHGKRTLVIGVKKQGVLRPREASSNYRLVLSDGCMGCCEYCYLHTQLWDKPYIRIFVNTDEILSGAGEYIKKHFPQTTVFEGSSTCDPVCTEPYTGILKKCTEYFAKQQNAKFRFATKFTDIDSLIDVDHRGHTEIRFRINTDRIIKAYEHYTPSVGKRIEAAVRLSKAGYPIGFIIAPVFIYDGWIEEYNDLIENLRSYLPQNPVVPFFFEVVSHRFTPALKERILQIFPNTTLPMEEEKRQYKREQFGLGKFVYPTGELRQIRSFFTEQLSKNFGPHSVKHII